MGAHRDRLPRRSAPAPGRGRSARTSRTGILAFLLLVLPLVGCRERAASPRDDISVLFSGEAAAWVDLTHPFDDSTIYWPTAEAFRLERVSADSTEGGYWYAANNVSAAEHGGTHLDAPYHFAMGGATAAEIPVDRLVGPAVVVDVRDAASRDRDYQVTVSDLEGWEKEYGRMPQGAIVLLRTGWGSRWPNPVEYLGTSARGQDAVADLHFPGLSPDAARWLVDNRSVDAVGLDTPSVDYGQSTRFRSHRILFEAGVPAIENVARLDQLPPRGAFVVALPMKIEGGTGAPMRIVGVVPRIR